MKATILIIDDEPNVRESLAKALRLSGYETVVAADGREGAAAYRQHLPNLVLLDLNMPVRNGWDTLEAISTINPLTPVVIITGRPGQFERAAAARVGALLEKPLDVPRLLQTIQMLIAEPIATRLARLSYGDPGTIYCTSSGDTELAENAPALDRLRQLRRQQFDEIRNHQGSLPRRIPNPAGQS